MNATQKARHVSELSGMTIGNSHQWLCDNLIRIKKVRDKHGWSMREALNWAMQNQ